MPKWTLYEGDCLDVMRQLPDNSVDAVVTDPPYGLSREPDIEEVLRHWLAGDDYKHRGGGFMGKTWDSFVPGPAVWREVFRVVKPGGHILCFAGTRTVDLMGISLRLGGFEIRDCLQWLYGSGFPKSLDVSKAIDKMAGTAEARRWHGWGTALKPAVEPITRARKPLSEPNVAANVLRWGTGGLNIDGCRIGENAGWCYPHGRGGKGWGGRESLSRNLTVPISANKGRWPANVLLDEEAAAMLDEQSGYSKSSDRPRHNNEFKSVAKGRDLPHTTYGYADEGGASRFFYVAKASRSERTM